MRDVLLLRIKNALQELALTYKSGYSHAGFRDLFSSSIVVGIAAGMLGYCVDFAGDLLLNHSHQHDLSFAVSGGLLVAAFFFAGNRHLLKKP